jgi:signal transduction histidine kinase
MSSLRTRLWLGYVLVVGVALFVVFWGLSVSIQRNALFYPQAVLQLRAVENRAAARLNELSDQTQQMAMLRGLSQTSGKRLVWLDEVGQVLLDSGEGQQATFAPLRLRRLVMTESLQSAGMVRDRRQKTWLYSLQVLDDGSFLLTMMPRPAFVLRTLIRNEMIAPLISAGAVALFLALGLSLAIGNWVAKPLQQLGDGARRLAGGEYPSLVVDGPLEVKELAHAFNEMSRKVQVTQQAQRDFLANVTHELKTPLTSIQGFAQAILDGAVQTPQQVQQAAQVMYQEAERMNRLVLDLLTLARLESGVAGLRRDRLDIAVLLEQVRQKFAVQAQSQQVALVLQVSALPVFWGDGDRLMQVLSNLVDNALRYTPCGGTVWLSAQMEEGWLLMTVRDCGPGIALEEQERIFERFYQADRSRRSGRGGVGLGLPIARQICRAHGGDLFVRSSPGQGSTFVVKLPSPQAQDDTSNMDRMS